MIVSVSQPAYLPWLVREVVPLTPGPTGFGPPLGHGSLFPEP